MRVSFISALHNNLPLTKEMFASLQATLPRDIEAEFVFVNNASNDGTAEWLTEQQDSRLRHQTLERNVGYGPANNLAVEYAKSEIVVLLNNDIVLKPGWLQPMLQGLSQCKNPGIIGNLQFRVSDRALDHRGVKFDLLRRPYHDRRPSFLTFGRRFSQYPAVTAACCAIHRSVFLEADGFDSAYENGYEDIDFCLRLGRAGYSHYVANRSKVLHHVSASSGRFSSESANLRLFLERWGWPDKGPSQRIRGLNYLGRHWLRPWRFNGGKLLLALAWLFSGGPCKSIQEKLGVTIEYKPK